jgi:hypothetical protein
MHTGSDLKCAFLSHRVRRLPLMAAIFGAVHWQNVADKEQMRLRKKATRGEHFSRVSSEACR